MDADAIEEGRRRWQARYDKARKRDADFTTLSGDRVAGSAGRGPATRTRDSSGSAGPGDPFTRGR
ncbi:methylmalonyl-CoA mutase OS=Streptomyces alboniger OX=132473 GN=CP975_24760 PE=4 SV=1 [Streptomyces alboniger]